MDSFFSLFDPNEGNSNNNNKKKQKPDVPQHNVKLKGRRRSRRGELKPDSLTEQSSFLCAPELDNDLLDRGNSYFDSYFEAPKDASKQDLDKKPKRRPHRRKSHTPPVKGPQSKGPQTEGPQTEPLNNRQQPKPRHPIDVGKNVNDLKKDEDLFEYMRKSRRKTEPFSEDQVYRRQPSAEEIEINQVLGQLESISLKEDDYSYSDYCPDDMDDSCSDDEENFEDSSSEQEDATVYGYLPPEPRYGNVEYKLQLVSVTEKRFQHLVTQLKWRLASGNGRCTYVVGVTDRGAVTGLSRRKLRASLRTLRRMAACLRVAARVTVRGLPERRAVAEVTARKLPDTQQSVELRIAVLGANDAGKSTLIGVLTQGELDNGRGSARLNMFRHVHEVRSGRTSSLSHELLGFDAQGSVVNYGCSQLMTAERIGERSSKLVSFLDLAGHYKYQRTTVRGLTGYCPHYASLIVSASAGITAITEEHISLLIALEQPFFTVVNKCELLSEEQRNGILRELADLFAVGNKKPLLITNEEMARNCAGPQILNNLVTNNNNNINIKQLDSNNESHIQSIPVFPISCVTGQGLNALQAYLLALEPTASGSDWSAQQEPCEFQIDEIFHVGDSPGPIVGGLQAMGKLYEGDNLLIGPLETGEFVEISVKTIYRNRVPCDMVKAGQSASLGLSHYPPNLRQGMVLLAIPKNYKTNHKSPTFGACTNGKCKNLPLPDVIAAKKGKKLRRNRNLMQDLVTVESSLKKSVDIEGSNIYKSSDESDGGDKFECRCTGKVYLEDPDDPRGCLYFQAKIHLLRHSSPHISPGFQCTVHVGNVRQTAVIVGIMSVDSRLTVGSSASALLRFSRAEYLRANRRAVCRAGQATVAVATLLQIFPYRP